MQTTNVMSIKKEFRNFEKSFSVWTKSLTKIEQWFEKTYFATPKGKPGRKPNRSTRNTNNPDYQAT